ncbi:MAG: YlxR family protein [Lachnospiraceae bacterium]|nr:YlxR family protein [Lachnospiraceae bacterium]
MAVKRKIPQRMCIGCGQMKDKRDMLRIIKTSEDEILIDATGKKNGRGAYICFSQDCLSKAVKNKGLERSLKKAIPSEVYDSLRKELESIEAR